MMIRRLHKKGRLWFFKAVLVFIFICCVGLGLPNRKTSSYADAYSGDRIAIHSYDIRMDIGADRQIRVQERIEVEFLKSGLTMFYRSLPVENARYYDISAKCENNPEFFFEVADNPDVDGFFDINCIGGAQKGNVWTYEIAFTMENSYGAVNTANGMHIDVVPFGFTVPLHNVTGEVHFPYAVEKDDFLTYVGYGGEDSVELGTLSEDGKTYAFFQECLTVEYNDVYSERVAQGVSIEFIMQGSFSNYTAKRIFTDGMWVIVLGGVIGIALAVLAVVFLKKKSEIVTVVNITAPDNLDPMRMGKLLDGNVDDEDVTSMIFYFAYKGYLTIDMQDEKNPTFIKRCALPANALPHEKTLFNGLFASGNKVSTQDLKEKFYVHVDTAKMQLAMPKMYKKPSIVAYVLGGGIAVLYMLLITMGLATARFGATYTTFTGLVWLAPVAVILLLGFVMECYRYKWKPALRNGMRVGQIAVAVIGTAIYTAFFTKHIFTEYERLMLCVFASIIPFITQNAICRTEEYCDTLGQILGFKDFIVVTEEEKIKFMLEENPTLYYKILPYAQVLGVTDEWENKFKNILVEPPEWYTGSDITYFDYMIMRSALRGAMRTAVSRPSEGGSRVGRSGGGGSFGSFGGGGFGGGGGGAR